MFAFTVVALKSSVTFPRPVLFVFVGQRSHRGVLGVCGWNGATGIPGSSEYFREAKMLVCSGDGDGDGGREWFCVRAWQNVSPNSHRLILPFRSIRGRHTASVGRHRLPLHPPYLYPITCPRVCPPPPRPYAAGRRVRGAPGSGTTGGFLVPGLVERPLGRRQAVVVREPERALSGGGACRAV